eukprot:5165323-Amphidinium_carterae.1
MPTHMVHCMSMRYPSAQLCEDECLPPEVFQPPHEASQFSDSTSCSGVELGGPLLQSLVLRLKDSLGLLDASIGHRVLCVPLQLSQFGASRRL